MQGTYIGEYCGDVLSQKEKEARDKANEEWGSRDSAFYIMSLTPNYYLDAEVSGSVLRYANHSCNPNCFSQLYIAANGFPHVCLFALRDISPGEELTFRYSNKQHKNAVTFECRCLSANCTGFFHA